MVNRLILKYFGECLLNLYIKTNVLLQFIMNTLCMFHPWIIIFCNKHIRVKYLIDK
jgi:hypothetical protein